MNSAPRVALRSLYVSSSRSRIDPCPIHFVVAKKIVSPLNLTQKSSLIITQQRAFSKELGTGKETSETHFKCPSCDFHISNKNDLKQHIISVHKTQPYWCPHCNLGYSNILLLNKHIKRIHLGLPTVKVPFELVDVSGLPKTNPISKQDEKKSTLKPTLESLPNPKDRNKITSKSKTDQLTNNPDVKSSKRAQKKADVVRQPDQVVPGKPPVTTSLTDVKPCPPPLEISRQTNKSAIKETPPSSKIVKTPLMKNQILDDPQLKKQTAGVTQTKTQVVKAPLTKNQIVDGPRSKKETQVFEVPPIKTQIIDVPLSKKEIAGVTPSKSQIFEVPTMKNQIVDAPRSKKEIFRVTPTQSQIFEAPTIKNQIIDAPRSKNEIIGVAPAKTNVFEVPPTKNQIVDAPCSKKEIVGVTPPKTQVFNAPEMKNQVVDTPLSTKKHIVGVPLSENPTNNAISPPTIVDNLFEPERIKFLSNKNQYNLYPMKGDSFINLDPNFVNDSSKPVDHLKEKDLHVKEDSSNKTPEATSYLKSIRDVTYGYLKTIIGAKK